MAERTVYKPLSRVLIDLLVGTDALFFLVFALGGIDLKTTVLMAVSLNVATIIFWLLVIVPHFQVVFAEKEISGPSQEFFKRTSFLLIKIDRERLLERSKKAKKLGYYDLKSRDGKTIRLWRRLLGRRQVYKIFKRFEENSGFKIKPYYGGYGGFGR